MTTILRIMGFAAVALLIGNAYSQSDRTFTSAIARIHLTIPPSWKFQNLETIARNRAAARLKDQELQRAVEQMASAPLVVATKHPEPYPSLNPSFQLLVRPLGRLSSLTGAQILALVQPTLEKSFSDFILVSPIQEVMVGRLPGAMLTARYTVSNQSGQTFPTQATIVAIPRDSFLYQISFSAPPDGPDALRSKVKDVLGSIEFLE